VDIVVAVAVAVAIVTSSPTKISGIESERFFESSIQLSIEILETESVVMSSIVISISNQDYYTTFAAENLTISCLDLVVDNDD
jgi:hypothetical protein